VCSSLYFLSFTTPPTRTFTQPKPSIMYPYPNHNPNHNMTFNLASAPNHQAYLPRVPLFIPQPCHIPYSHHYHPSQLNPQHIPTSAPPYPHYYPNTATYPPPHPHPQPYCVPSSAAPNPHFNHYSHLNPHSPANPHFTLNQQANPYYPQQAKDKLDTENTERLDKAKQKRKRDKTNRKARKRMTEQKRKMSAPQLSAARTTVGTLDVPIDLTTDFDPEVIIFPVFFLYVLISFSLYLSFLSLSPFVSVIWFMFLSLLFMFMPQELHQQGKK
jgi:hypothetical protein